MRVYSMVRIVLFVHLFFVVSVSAELSGTEDLKLETARDKASYALGADLGRNMRDRILDIDTDLFIRGLRDEISDRESLLSDAEMQQAIQEYRVQLGRRMEDRVRELGEQNARVGKAFLAENADKEGVHVTDSGLQYEALKPGEGKRPSLEDTVKVHYTGMLIHGEIFDSSRDRGEPAELNLREMIPGWREGVPLMREGAVYRFFIPPDLAYGERGAPPVIGPNATLIFDVELIEVMSNE